MQVKINHFYFLSCLQLTPTYHYTQPDYTRMGWNQLQDRYLPSPSRALDNPSFQEDPSIYRNMFSILRLKPATENKIVISHRRLGKYLGSEHNTMPSKKSPSPSPHRKKKRNRGGRGTTVSIRGWRILGRATWSEYDTHDTDKTTTAWMRLTAYLTNLILLATWTTTLCT